MGVVNKPEGSRTIVGFYAGMAVFLAVLFSVIFYFIYADAPEGSFVGLITLAVIAPIVEGLMLWVLASLYRTRYVLTDSELVLEASSLIGGSKRISLDTIESVQRTLIPFGFRLFGASFHGGHYYFPSVGRAFMIITNFRDGVLIKAKNGNYVITPSNPDDFIAKINVQTETKT
jgi:Bacterial PH domain